jgi:hypothetical protein
MSLSTYSLEFTAWAGANPYPAQRTVRVLFEGNPTRSFTATTDADWLRLGPAGTDTVFVTVISTDLAAGNYVDSIAVSIAASTNGPLYVRVELNVLNQVMLSPASMTGSFAAGVDNRQFRSRLRHLCRRNRSSLADPEQYGRGDARHDRCERRHHRHERRVLPRQYRRQLT